MRRVGLKVRAAEVKPGVRVRVKVLYELYGIHESPQRRHEPLFWVLSPYLLSFPWFHGCPCRSSGTAWIQGFEWLR